MRLLVIGGAGTVGTMVVPHLAERHDVTVFDRKPPSTSGSYVAGDVRDFEAVQRAVTGQDVLLFMAMGPLNDWDQAPIAAQHFDVAGAGLYLALRAAAEAGIRRAVYTSSMSVYQSPPPGRCYPNESVPPDATHFYGVAKQVGELVCRSAAAEWDLSVVALRLCHPTAPDNWPVTEPPERRHIATSAADTARALLAALDYPGGGFSAFTISGDTSGRYADITLAGRELGWAPHDPTLP